MKLKATQKATRGKAMLSLRIERADGSVDETKLIPNSRVDVGALWMYNQLAGLGTPGPGTFIALSGESQTILKNMTALSSEISTDGLARAAGSVQNYTIPGTLDGAANYQLTRTFIYSGIAPRVIAAAAVFDATVGGSLIWIFNITPSHIVNLNDRVIASILINI